MAGFHSKRCAFSRNIRLPMLPRKVSLEGMKGMSVGAVLCLKLQAGSIMIAGHPIYWLHGTANGHELLYIVPNDADMLQHCWGSYELMVIDSLATWLLLCAFERRSCLNIVILMLYCIFLCNFFLCITTIRKEGMETRITFARLPYQNSWCLHLINLMKSVFDDDRRWRSTELRMTEQKGHLSRYAFVLSQDERVWPKFLSINDPRIMNLIV